MLTGEGGRRRRRHQVHEGQISNSQEQAKVSERSNANGQECAFDSVHRRRQLSVREMWAAPHVGAENVAGEYGEGMRSNKPLRQQGDAMDAQLDRFD